jgi:hypothetical protein
MHDRLRRKTMKAELSSVDALTMAVFAAGILRSSGDPEVALANAYAALSLEPPERSTPLAIRIVQLILDAGRDRRRLHDYLRRIEGPLAWDRPPSRPDQEVELVDEDEEARRFVEMLKKRELGPGHSMFWRSDPCPYFPSFRLLERSAVLWFDGPAVVLRNGQELPAPEAVPPQTGDEWSCKPLELPKKVRGLIDYPFEVATLFDIETTDNPWDVWDICCSFADQYMKLYERPEKYGIWGADLSSLWIEDLLYYPDHHLIYPRVGS